MPVTGEEIRDSLLSPIVKCMGDNGLSLDYLVKRLKKELNASEDRHVKDLENSSPGNPVYKLKKQPLWLIRQQARKDAHKLRGDYPAEKHEVASEVEFVLRDCVKEAREAAESGKS